MPPPRRLPVAKPAPFGPGEEGFTLVEVLVAMVILAVAAAGLIGAAEAHVDSIRAMQSRAAAQWVAENRIVELTVSPAAAPPGGEVVEMLGQTWAVQVSRRQSDDPDLDAMTVSVAEPGSPEPLVTIDFFVDRQRAALP
jgi:general secretion pathway protein I